MTISYAIVSENLKHKNRDWTIMCWSMIILVITDLRNNYKEKKNMISTLFLIFSHSHFLTLYFWISFYVSLCVTLSIRMVTRLSIRMHHGFHLCAHRHTYMQIWPYSICAHPVDSYKVLRMRNYCTRLDCHGYGLLTGDFPPAQAKHEAQAVSSEILSTR